MKIVTDTYGCLKVGKEELVDKNCFTCMYWKFKEWKTGYIESCLRGHLCGDDKWNGWKPYGWLMVEGEVEL